MAGRQPESLFVAADASLPPAAADVVEEARRAGVRVLELAPGVMARVADTVTPQPLLGVFPMVHATVLPQGAQLVVVLADVRDPGNAGTIVRTADAAGVDAVVCCGGTVDPYNPKTVRSSAGSVFHVPLVELRAGDDAPAHGVETTLGALRSAGFRCLGAVPRDGVAYTDVDWTERTALVLGNEAAGLAPTLPLDAGVVIPMAGRAESLNVAVACAVLCFEALRQRRSTIAR